MMALATIVSSPAMAATQAGFDLLDFRLSQFSVFEGQGGNSFTAYAGWAPTYMFSNTLGARIDAGVGALQTSTAAGGKTTLLAGGNALAVYALNDTLSLEAGPGYQQWLESGRTGNLTATGGVVYSFAQPLLWVIEGASLDYTASFQTNNLSHQIRVGAVF